MSEEVKTKETVNQQRDEKQQYVLKYGFDQPCGKWDLILKVEGVSIHVSHVVLEMCSSVFEKMIQDVKDVPIEIEIHDTKCEDFVDFLTCFYPGKDHQLTDDSVFKILPLACVYHVEQVVKQCGQYLLTLVESNKTPRQLLVQCMDAAYDHDLTNVKEEAKNQLLAIELADDQISTALEPYNKKMKALPSNTRARLDFYEKYIPALKHEIEHLRVIVKQKNTEIGRVNLSINRSLRRN